MPENCKLMSHPETIHTDVAIIGGGPGGYVAAIRLSQLGKQVTLIEKESLGGVCLNWGCIPSKALIQAGRLYEKISVASQMGIMVSGLHLDMPTLQQWKSGVVNRLTGGIGQLLEKNGVQVLKGIARFKDEKTLSVSTTGSTTHYQVCAQHIVIATGSAPAGLPQFPLDGQTVIGSRDALALQYVPKSMVVIGGGVIGLEMATMYAKLGSDVTIVELSEVLLPGVDNDVVKLLKRSLQKRNITVHTGSTVESVVIHSSEKATSPQATVTIKTPQKTYECLVDVVLVCVGRVPNTSDLGLQAIGVTLSKKGFIQADNQLRTSVPHIFAIGDVVAPPLLAHKASKEGMVAAAVIAGQPEILDYKALPSVIFCEPEIATVGLKEEEATAKGYRVKTGNFPFSASGRALTMDETEGLVKLVTDADTGLLLGAHLIGPDVSELIAEAALAIEMGATAEDIALTVHAHPTLPESMMEAAEAVAGKAIHIFNSLQR